jgi:cyanate permease
MTAPTANPTQHPYRWLMLFGASSVYACFGAVMAAMAVLVKPISESLSLSPLHMGIILGAWQFVYLFASIPTGAMLDRFGLRPCLLLAGLTLAASAALRVVADSFSGLLFAVLLFGLGGPLISLGAPKLVSRWFAGSERGLAMGLYMSSSGIGALLATILTNSTIMPLVGGDWQATFSVYAIVTLISVALWLGIASHPYSRMADRTVPGAVQRLDFRIFGKLLAHKELRVIMLMAFTMFFFIHAMNAWLPEVLRGKGLSLIDAGYWAAVPTIVAIIAALVVTRLALPHRRLSILTGVAIIAIASVIFLEIQPLALLAFCLMGQGIPRSCLVPIALLMLMESKALGGDSMGAASGLFFTAGQVGGVLGPFLCGLAISATGNYDTPLWIMGLSMVMLLALLAFHSRSP